VTLTGRAAAAVITAARRAESAIAAVLTVMPGRDDPVPYTLTPKACGVLGGGPGPRDGEWACGACGDAFFSTPPDDGMCPDCRDYPYAREHWHDDDGDEPEW
jgi:hypothetical protein